MESDIGFMFKKIHDAIETGINNSLKKQDLTFSQMGVLVCLFKNNGRVTTQRDIEKFLCLKHPTVVGIIHRLSCKGFIEVSVNEQDHRSRCITMTHKGEMLREHMTSRREASRQAMLHGFTDEESQLLQCYLQRIYDNILKFLSEDTL